MSTRINRSHLVRYLLLTTTLLALSACAHLAPESTHPLDMDRLLEQINQSLQAAAQGNLKPSPPISSVQLDLQVGMTRGADVQLPINLVVLSGDADQQAVHHISLNFVPDPQPPADPTHNIAAQFPGLTEAIRAIYQAGLSSKSGFLLRSGSVKVECTLSTDGSAGVSVLGLVPLQLGANYSHQTVQTITLNFGDQADDDGGGPGAANASGGGNGSGGNINSISSGKNAKSSLPATTDETGKKGK